MEKWDRIVIRNGNPVMLGANKNEEGMNFAAEVLPGAEAALVLYQKGSAVHAERFLLQNAWERYVPCWFPG